LEKLLPVRQQNWHEPVLLIVGGPLSQFGCSRAL
jgi:hypothetical protein